MSLCKRSIRTKNIQLPERNTLICFYYCFSFHDICEWAMFKIMYINVYWDRRGYNRMLVGFTTTYAISAYQQ